MLFTNLRRQLSFLIGLQNDHWNWRNCVQHSPADLIHLHLTMELFEIIASNNQKQTIGEFMTSLLLLLWYFLSPPQYRGDLSVPCSFDLCVSFFFYLPGAVSQAASSLFNIPCIRCIYTRVRTWRLYPTELGTSGARVAPQSLCAKQPSSSIDQLNRACLTGIECLDIFSSFLKSAVNRMTTSPP